MTRADVVLAALTREVERQRAVLEAIPRQGDVSVQFVVKLPSKPSVIVEMPPVIFSLQHNPAR